MKYVDMVLHESPANAGFERLAKVCEGCGKEFFCRQDRVRRLDRGVPGHLDVCYVHSRNAALEELTCVGNGGLTSSHFVQCGVIFVLVMVSFHHYHFGHQQEESCMRLTVILNLVRC